MEDKDLSGVNQKTIRSSREIKAGLLRRAFDGLTKRPASEIISMLNAAYKRSAEMPKEHQEILNDIIPGQPACILRLNAQMRAEGRPERYIDTSNFVPGPLTPQ